MGTIIPSNPELGRVLRRRLPEGRRVRLFARGEAACVALADLGGLGPAAVLPDTNVYVRAAAGTLPDRVFDVLDQAVVLHSPVCLAELAEGIAAADPRGAGWRRMRAHYAGLVESIPGCRLVVPEADVLVEAGLVAGTLARTQGWPAAARGRCFNDAVVLLSAARIGVPVLTSDREGFDLLRQLVPAAVFLYY